MNLSKFILTTLLLSGIIAQCNNALKSSDFVNSVSFATIVDGQKLLVEEDDFVKSWSAFDIDSRVQKQNATKEEAFELIKANVLEWTNEEKNVISNIILEIDSVVAANNYHLPFPEAITFIKTTMDEEGGASGYTRGNNIILGEKAFDGKIDNIKHLIIHELFHVLSRNDVDFKAAMYKIIGFTTTDIISYPDSIANLKITNPDAPLTDAFITLETKDGPVDCAMILYADRPWNGGSFFNYMNLGFMRLTGEQTKTPYLKDEQPVFYTMSEALNFFSQVGKNTNYIIHPEEIMADNFTSLLLEQENLADPWLIDEIQDYLID